MARDAGMGQSIVIEVRMSATGPVAVVHSGPGLTGQQIALRDPVAASEFPAQAVLDLAAHVFATQGLGLGRYRITIDPADGDQTVTYSPI